MNDLTKKSDEEILFPNKIIAGIEVKPWSFGTLFEISSMLEIVLDKVDEKKIIVDIGFISYFDMLRIFSLASQEVLNIIAITVEKDVEEIQKLSIEDGVKLAIEIYQSNSTTLKNVLSSLFPTTIPETGAQEPEKVQDSEE